MTDPLDMLREGDARIDADAPTGTQLDDNTIARVDSDFYNIIIGVLGAQYWEAIPSM